MVHTLQALYADQLYGPTDTFDCRCSRHKPYIQQLMISSLKNQNLVRMMTGCGRQQQKKFNTQGPNFAGPPNQPTNYVIIRHNVS